ncbi:MAG TPA: ATP-dependent DNA ligase, partial [Xanthomonadaceae bacterium]|nr:ATP-dependent DNA ligase [Xanthomonadaceae bacterium]
MAGARARIAGSGELRQWIGEAAGIDDWLVADSYDHVGDLAETLALLLDDPPVPGADLPLADWIELRLLPVANREPEQRKAVVLDAWRSLVFDERLVFNKLLTGALRVGVSQRLVQQALAEMSGVDIARIAQRMLGSWKPSPAFVADLLTHAALPIDRQQPYPFFLASPLEGDGAALGPIDDWLLEWKWDGIRLQLLRRAGQVALWSRGEERLDGRFPEIEQAAQALPEGTVIDGELMAWRQDDPLPLPFSALQTRIQRLKPGPRTLAAAPARVLAYDLLELAGE